MIRAKIMSMVITSSTALAAPLSVIFVQPSRKRRSCTCAPDLLRVTSELLRVTSELLRVTSELLRVTSDLLRVTSDSLDWTRLHAHADQLDHLRHLRRSLEPL